MRILLAAQTPLYMPVYLAAQEMERRGRQPITLDVAPMEPKNDLLVKRTLGKAVDTSDAVLAVGDLVRLSSYLGPSAGLDAPVIAGGLVDKMCLWLMDGLDPNDVTRLMSPDEEFAILSHPRHMTSYHVALYELLNRSATADRDKAIRRVRSILPPDKEDSHYRIWRAALSALRRPVAYMTSDFVAAFHAHNNQRGLLKDFTQDTRFQNISMTGFFTSSTKGMKERQFIQDFLGYTLDALTRMNDDPTKCAHELSSYAELHRLGADADFERLDMMVKQLVRVDAYAADLALTQSQLEQSCRIRTAAEPSTDPVTLGAALWAAHSTVFAPTTLAAKSPADECAERHQLYREFHTRSAPRPVIDVKHAQFPWVLRIAYFSAAIFAFQLWREPGALLVSSESVVANPYVIHACAVVWIVLVLLTDGKRFVESFPRVPFLPFCAFALSGVLVAYVEMQLLFDFGEQLLPEFVAVAILAAATVAAVQPTASGRVISNFFRAIENAWGSFWSLLCFIFSAPKRPARAPAVVPAGGASGNP